MKDKIIAKLKELNEHLTKLLHSCKYEVIDDNSKWQRLESELAALEQENKTAIGQVREAFEPIQLEQQSKEQSAEEILEKHCGKVADIYRSDAINAMQEYSQQSRRKIIKGWMKWYYKSEIDDYTKKYIKKYLKLKP